MDGRFMVFEFKYTSMRSNELEGEVTHVFRINFIDECYNTELTPAINDDVTIPLFEFFYESMQTYSVSSFKCEPVVYTLFVTESTAVNPVEIFWNLDYKDYELYPDTFNMRGTYTLILRSCVPVRDEKVCVVSPTWEVEVYDPCNDTSIISAGWQYILEAPIKGSAELNFSTQIKTEFGNYPWITQVDVNQRGEFMCGQIAYSLRALDYEENPITPLVILDGTLIILQPSPAFSPGDYTLELVGTIVDYP